MERSDPNRQPNDVASYFAAIEALTNFERRPAASYREFHLRNMRALLDSLGAPAADIPVVHIAGSKGKGSTAAFLSSLLATEATVGLYTSPHVLDYRERFQIVPAGQVAGAAPPPQYEQILLEQLRRVWDAAGSGDFTTFELLTALAFCLFDAAGCNWIVLETGLGGRLDATNVCSPVLVLLTRIELEHTEYLGDTIAAIAGEKAGIIKSSVPAISAPQAPDAAAVFDRTADQRSVQLHLMQHSEVDTIVPPEIELGLAGPVQRVNAAQAVLAQRALAASGLSPQLTATVVREALVGTRLPGRGELRGRVLLDGAHTPQSVANAVAALQQRFPNVDRFTVVFAAVNGKDWDGMLRVLAPLTRTMVVTTPGTFRASDPQAIAELAIAHNIPVQTVPDPTAALATALAAPGPVLVTGSFYLLGELRDWSAIRALAGNDTQQGAQ